jgi:hypothetical protein
MCCRGGEDLEQPQLLLTILSSSLVKASQPGFFSVGIRASLRMAFTSSRNPGE